RVAAPPAPGPRMACATRSFTARRRWGGVGPAPMIGGEPIRRYSALIPEPGATVRHVLTHTSEGVPGQSFRHNGDRFVALTPVVETCWGAPFRVVLAREILSRLAMQDSVPGHDLEQPDAATAGLFDREVLTRYQRVLLNIARPYALRSPRPPTP